MATLQAVLAGTLPPQVSAAGQRSDIIYRPVQEYKMMNKASPTSSFERACAVASQIPPLIRVTAHSVMERTRRFQAKDVYHVPVDSSEVTCEWLTAVLCRNQPMVKVVGFRSESVPTGTSTRWIMSVDYDANAGEVGLPTRVFAKSTRDLSQRVLMGVSETISGEASFYSDYRLNLTIEAPHGYHGAWDPATWRSIVLMEDVVATKGAEFLNAAASVSKLQAADLLRNLATMHGTMWENARITKLQTPADIGRVFSTYTDMHARYRSGMARAAAVIPDTLKNQIESLHLRLKSALAAASSGPQTLIHGDAHIGNTYRTSFGTMGYGDWQVVRRGSWAFDVAMTIVTGLAIEDRRAWERELLAEYLDQLARSGGPLINLDVAFDQYRELVVYPYLAWLCTIGRGPLQPKMQSDNICRLVIERAGAAVVDLK